MKGTSGNKSANKETYHITAIPLESIELQDNTVEEKRLKLALDLRRRTCS